MRKSAVARREAAHAEFLRELVAKPFTGMALCLTAWAEEGRTHARLVGANPSGFPIRVNPARNASTLPAKDST
jgi:hypothetical protein